MAPLFGDLIQSEKLSKIKPPLIILKISGFNNFEIQRYITEISNLIDIAVEKHRKTEEDITARIIKHKSLSKSLF